MNLETLQAKLASEGWVLFRIWYDPTKPRPWNIGAHTKGDRKFQQGWGATLELAVEAMLNPPKPQAPAPADINAIMKALDL